MTRGLLVTQREVLAFLRDKGDLAFGLLLPIAIFALMYGAFGGGMDFNGTAHIVNLDQQGAYSAMLLEQLDELDNLEVDLLTRENADSKLERSDLLMVIYIPEDFSGNLAYGERAQLLFKQRGNGGQEGQVVASIVSGVAERVAQEARIRSRVEAVLIAEGVAPDGVEASVQVLLEEERESPTVRLIEDTLGTSPDPVKEFLPGIVTMFVLFAVTISARALVEERKKGTLERLLTTRLTVGQLFVGKFVANVSRGFIQTFILFTLSYAVFQLFTPVSFVEALAIAAVFSAAVSSLGLVIGSVARSEEQATWIAVFFTMVMVLLGGTFFEISEGSVLDTLSKLSVNTYANEAFKTLIVDGGSAADVGLELGVLAGIGVVGLVVARMLFRVVPGGR